MEVVKWIFVVAALAGVALALVELATEEPDTATDSAGWTGGHLGAEDPGWPDGGDHRRRRHRGRPGVRWRGVYEAKGREWVVREAPKESHTANTAYHGPITDYIIFSAIL